MKNQLKNKKVLITYGPTWIALDDMRVISNRSSGTMGKLIVKDLINAGAKVTALEGPITEPVNQKDVRVIKFTFFDDLAKLFKIELKKKYDIVIHAAAVSDFKPAQKNRTKLSSNKKINLTLVPTKKLINQIKKLAPKSFLVGFKLKSTTSQIQLKKEAMKSINKNKCDLVVANSLKDGYNGFIFNKNGALLAKGKSRKTISNQLVGILCKI